jgi:tellurite methyltransferase
MSDSQEFWKQYYSAHKNPPNECAFASFVMPFLEAKKTLCELGCGNGRDSIYFAKNGVNTISFDQCEEEMVYLDDKFQNHLPTSFRAGDFTNLEKIEDINYLYSRFTLHAIDEEGQARVIKWAFENLEPNGIFFIEVRSTKDELYGVGEEVSRNAFFSDHYRRFLIMEELIEELKSVGFSLLYSLQSKGLAVYKDDDPEVMRVIVQKI